MDKLTPKQEAFIEAYLGEAVGNATRAAELAGYKGNAVTLSAVGAENLRKPQIVEALDRRKLELASDPATLTPERLRRFWLAVIVNDKEATRDRLKASELAGRALGQFIERREHSGPAGGPIDVNGASPADIAAQLTDEELAQLRTIRKRLAETQATNPRRDHP